MLVEFRVENHRSIRSEQVFTFEVGRVTEAAETVPREVGGKRVLPVAAVYGANASGKSNLLAALGFMREAVLYSHRAWSPEGGVPREPFAWGPARAEPSLFEVTVVVQGVRYQYGFVGDDERFLEEWLYAWPKGHKQTWLEREGDDFKFGDFLQGKNRVVEEVTRDNALFLSAAVQHSHRQLAPLYRWFRAMRLVNVPGRRRPDWALGERWLTRALAASSEARQATLFDESSESERRLTAFRDLLQAADVGILDFKIEEQGESYSHHNRRGQILVRHRSAHDEAWLPLEEESQGTLTLFRIGPVLLDTLWSGGVLVVDELEASLHPLLALHIVRLFNSPSTNPHNAQLLFTTHDTNLLGTISGAPPLRRDQVWLTEKDQDGGTTLYPLTDYKPRKAENLERGYLQGRYGAVPFLGAFVAGEE